eukprot:gb/GECH01006958.1/.p1 GENE.gb/GECH01006958.1/~~gb/GECH01006958.1/.p1  ORF type:complete len:355 (+),score=52.28 gb/GECH01006958.1/:1-1065(+)
MGNCIGPADEAEAEAKRKDRQVKKLMKEHQEMEETEIKLLLLGTGESGKSTIFKQVRIIHKKGYSEEECKKFKGTIHGNVYVCSKALVKAVDRFQLEYEDPEVREIADRVKSTHMSDYRLDPERAADIKKLWNDGAVQQAYQRRSEFQLYDSCAYFMSDLDRLAAPDYVPKQDDVLRCRVKTVGITEMELQLKGTNFRIVDVGGQRNERRKWIHAFDNVTAIIFVVSLSEYDQNLFEDNKMNRMQEALLLFDEICNNRYFKNTSVIVFFNKKDLFEEKIKHTDLSVCFSDYTDGQDYHKAIDFIIKKFVDENKNKKRTIYTYVTCATDTKNIQVVFNATKNIILELALNEAQLI